MERFRALLGRGLSKTVESLLLKYDTNKYPTLNLLCMFFTIQQKNIITLPKKANGDLRHVTKEVCWVLRSKQAPLFPRDAAQLTEHR